MGTLIRPGCTSRTRDDAGTADATLGGTVEGIYLCGGRVSVCPAFLLNIADLRPAIYNRKGG